MTNYYSIFGECKNPDCKQEFDKTDQTNYDDEGYCMACSEIKQDKIDKEVFGELRDNLTKLKDNLIKIKEKLKDE